MKQRILAILLSLTMMFTLVPTAMAEGEMAEAPAVTKVAKVGDVEYATLVEAVEAATDGATITLLKDAELTETLNINKAITCLLYTSPSPRDRSVSRMPSSA